MPEISRQSFSSISGYAASMTSRGYQRSSLHFRSLIIWFEVFPVCRSLVLELERRARYGHTKYLLRIRL
jgi:hypothetical protein